MHTFYWLWTTYILYSPKCHWIPWITSSPESSPALEQPHTFLLLYCLVCDTQSESVQRKKQKKKKTQSTFVWQTPSDPHMKPSQHVVSQRNFYPNWGHGKCTLSECHDSHTQNEVMWWDPARKRFVLISLCMYNAHRTVVLPGSIGAAVGIIIYCKCGLVEVAAISSLVKNSALI